MRFFPHRNKENQDSDTNLPPELRKYYENGRRERTSVAWLLAFASLLVTVLVVLGVFFGGRWIYRKIANHGKSGQVSTTQTSHNSSPSKPNIPAQPAKPPSNSQGSQESPSTSQPAPTTSTQQKNLVNTGPQGTVAAFVISATLGFGAYELWLYRKVKTN